MVMLSGLIFAPPVAQRRVAALTLFMSLVVVNLAPANPYFVATLQTWVQGKFLNFNGAAQCGQETVGTSGSSKTKTARLRAAVAGMARQRAG